MIGTQPFKDQYIHGEAIGKTYSRAYTCIELNDLLLKLHIDRLQSLYRLCIKN